MPTIFVQILTNIAPLLLAALVGFGTGKLLNTRTHHYFSRAITPVVWGILWVIGISAGAALGSFTAGLGILKVAACYALATSLATFVVLLPLAQKTLGAATPQRRSFTSLVCSLLPPIKECLLALGLVAIGVYCYEFGWQDTSVGSWLLSITNWLYLLLFLIGIELTQANINRSWVSLAVLKIPALVIVASLVAGAILSLLLDEKLGTSLALSSGFGWFSLSAGLASQHLGEPYGAIALFTDLTRELLGIVVVLLVGGRFAPSCIGVCGATAADTTLPFVRQACDNQQVPVALVSGLILTLTGPFLMLFFMSLN